MTTGRIRGGDGNGKALRAIPVFRESLGEGTMRRMLGAVGTAVAALVFATAAMAQDARESFPGWGVTLSVGWDEGSLLVGNGEEIRLIAVDSSTVIHDLYGTPMSLERIQPGEPVEYRAESWAGMLLARAVRVTSMIASAR